MTAATQETPPVQRSRQYIPSKGYLYPTDERGGTFRVLSGPYVGPPKPGCQCDGCRTPVTPTSKPEHRYRARRPNDPSDYDNDVIVSDFDLVWRFNHPGRIKFERLDERGQGSGPRYQEAPLPFPVKEMSYAQLLTEANEDHGLKLEANVKKDELAKLVEKARQEKAKAK